MRVAPFTALISILLVNCAATDDENPISGAVCAQREPADCLAPCPDGESCFTQVTCGPTSTGGRICSFVEGLDGDDRCHRNCQVSADCSNGDTCQRKLFFGCFDWDHAPNGRGICLRP